MSERSGMPHCGRFAGAPECGSETRGTDAFGTALVPETLLEAQGATRSCAPYAPTNAGCAKDRSACAAREPYRRGASFL